MEAELQEERLTKQDTEDFYRGEMQSVSGKL